MRAQARRRWLRTTIFSVAVALLGVAALRPRANPERTTFRREGRDLAIVLDVSRSMLAEDLRPSRLERAKLELDRLAEHLSGDRIGLIAFAGDAVIVCPLTSNYSYFRSTLKNLSVRSVSQGGTRIGDALRKALGDLLQVSASAPRPDSAAAKVGETLAEIDERAAVESRPADILLITDGEDHDSYPIHAAEQVRDAGVGLFILGIGSEEGTPIPVRGANGETRLLEHDGEIVRSRLDSSTLREMALKVPRGWYLPAGTQGFDLVEIHEDAIASEGGREIVEEHVSWTEIFQPFLLAGVALYFLFLLVSERTPSQLRERFAGLARETGSARAAPLAGV
ncbi:MAG TPA: VWA domain-containing protein, partial [Planctomycetota bacterium]|nr:VWA domain-containing protein [Planctomycetota bacterium]